jgi:hypothetical protein
MARPVLVRLSFWLGPPALALGIAILALSLRDSAPGSRSVEVREEGIPVASATERQAIQLAERRIGASIRRPNVLPSSSMSLSYVVTRLSAGTADEPHSWALGYVTKDSKSTFSVGCCRIGGNAVLDALPVHSQVAGVNLHWSGGVDPDRQQVVYFLRTTSGDEYLFVNNGEPLPVERVVKSIRSLFEDRPLSRPRH